MLCRENERKKRENKRMQTCIVKELERKRKLIERDYKQRLQKNERQQQKKLQQIEKEKQLLIRKQIRNNINKGFHPKYNNVRKVKISTENIIVAKNNIAQKLLNTKFNKNSKYIFQTQHNRLSNILQIKRVYNVQHNLQKQKLFLKQYEQKTLRDLQILKTKNPLLFSKIVNDIKYKNPILFSKIGRIKCN